MGQQSSSDIPNADARCGTPPGRSDVGRQLDTYRPMITETLIMSDQRARIIMADSKSPDPGGSHGRPAAETTQAAVGTSPRVPRPAPSRECCRCGGRRVPELRTPTAHDRHRHDPVSCLRMAPTATAIISSRSPRIRRATLNVPRLDEMSDKDFEGFAVQESARGRTTRSGTPKRRRP